ncbi:ATP-dependent nuclease, subunit B [Clostridiaceae bacterium JG1575]|nr:ATP-dependent nuclease, subunit B [Clostridiaceae bacterium JG1575]
MALAMIYGRSGSGKTTALFERIQASIAKDPSIKTKRYVIVPEQFTHMMEKNVLKHLGEEAVLRVHVMGFRRLSQRILESAGGIMRPVLSPVGRSMLLSALAQTHQSSLSLYQRSAAYAGFAHLMSQTVSELKNYAVQPEDLREAAEGMDPCELQSKLLDLSLLFAAYEEKLHEHFVDGEDQVQSAILKLGDTKLLKGCEFFLDEFTHFSPAQLAMIGGLMKQGDVTVALTLEEGIGASHEGVFSMTRDTDRDLLALAQAAAIAIDPPLFLKPDPPWRFLLREDLAHLERELYHYPPRLYKKEPKALRLYRALNPYEEMEFVARDIQKKVREEGYRFQDMAILLRDLAPYEAVLQSVMNQFEIPVFLDAPRTIDDTPLSTFLSALFEIARTQFRVDAVLKYLKTRLLPLTDATLDQLENYCIAHGITGYRMTLDEWLWAVPDAPEGIEGMRILNEINEARELCIMPLVALFERMEQAATVRELATVLYDFLAKEGVLERFQTWTESFAQAESTDQLLFAARSAQDLYRSYQQTQDALMNILDQMVEAMGEAPMSLEEFGNTLMVGLSEVQISLIPATLDQVIAGDISRVRSADVRCIYIVGGNDGVLPRTPTPQGFFTDSDRALLKDFNLSLAQDTRTLAFYEQFYVYNAFTTASDAVTLSYPSADAEGKALRPSVVVSRIKKLFPALVEASAPLPGTQALQEEVSGARDAYRLLIGQMRRHREGAFVDPKWRAIYGVFRKDPRFAKGLERAQMGLSHTHEPATLTVEHMDQLYGKELQLTVSRLESYNRCPFAYFVRYGMKAKERKEFVVGAPDVGTLMHEVLDAFTRRLQSEHLAWQDLSKETTWRYVDELMDRILQKEDHAVLASGPRMQHMAGKIKRIVASSIGTIREQIVRGDFTPLYSEVTFGPKETIPPVVLELDEEHRALITGRIDRVDVFSQGQEHYIRIIDYKSGKQELHLSDIVHGLQLQLLVYLDVVLRHAPRILSGEAIPGAALYFRVTKPLIKDGAYLSDAELEEKVLTQLRLKGMILSDAKVLYSMEREMEGISLVIPAKKTKGEVVAVGNQKNLMFTQEEFSALRTFATETVRRVCMNLLQGIISVSPIKTKRQTACDFCPYLSVCQFDPTMKGNDFRLLRELTPEQAWQIIHSKGGAIYEAMDDPAARGH